MENYQSCKTGLNKGERALIGDLASVEKGIKIATGLSPIAQKWIRTQKKKS